MKLDIHHHHHYDGPLPLGEIYGRLDLLQRAVSALIEHVTQQGAHMSAASDRLAKEVQETKDSVDTAVADIGALRAQVGKLNSDLADATAALRAAQSTGDDAAFNAAADALDQVQADIAAAVAPDAPGSATNPVGGTEVAGSSPTA